MSDGGEKSFLDSLPHTPIYLNASYFVILHFYF